MIVALLFSLYITHVHSAYNSNLYELGNNLIVNPSFTIPIMTSGYIAQNFASSILGWNCTTYCQLKNIPLVCTSNSWTCNVNYTQAIDLVSEAGLIENVSQKISVADEGQHLLHIEWTPPMPNHAGKTFTVYINGTAITTINVDSSNYSTYVSEVVVTLNQGSNLFSMKMDGNITDFVGAHISHVSLRKMTFIDEQFAEVMNALLSNNFTSSMNAVPGSRIFAYSLTNFLVNFDRLQFYYYHKHNLTFYSEIFLSKINTMQIEKGSITQRLLESCNDTKFCSSITNFYNYILESIDYQKPYTPQWIKQKNSNGIGFFANNLEFFFYQLPMITAIYIVMSILFNLLFNYRISRYIRKYSFYGILLLIVYEGNIEQFSFYFFSQCKNLFSANFAHKMSHVFMLFFFFFLIVFAVGGLVWFKYHYKKLLKYFMEDSKTTTFGAIIMQSFERSLFPLIFGCVHAMFIENLLIQSIIIGVIQVGYISIKVINLKLESTRYRFRVFMLTVSSLLRIVLIITLYMYESAGHPSLINFIHYDLVILYIVTWAVESIYDFGVFVKEIVEAIKYVCCYNSQEKPNKLGKKQKQILQATLQKANTSILKKKERQKIKIEKIKEKQTNQSRSRSQRKMRTQNGGQQRKEKKVNFKEPKEEKEDKFKYIKTTIHLELPDKTKSPEVVFYRKVTKQNYLKTTSYLP